MKGDAYSSTFFNFSMRFLNDSELIDIHECELSLGSKYQKDAYSFYVFWTAFGLFAISVFLAIVSVVFGVISWILIDKWRQFHNYVFLIGITQTALLFIAQLYVNNIRCINNHVFFKHNRCFIIVYVICVLLRISLNHWLLVATVMFYMDVVKVFNNRISRRYLVTNTFVWLAPIVEGAILFTTVFFCQLKVSDLEYITAGINCLLVLANTVLYSTVFYSLIALAVGDSSSRGTCEKIILSVAACITSGIVSYLPLALVFLCTESWLVKNIVCILSILTVIGVILLFLSLRSHREVWYEYLRRRNTLRIQCANNA